MDVCFCRETDFSDQKPVSCYILANTIKHECNIIVISKYKFLEPDADRFKNLYCIEP